MRPALTQPSEILLRVATNRRLAMPACAVGFDPSSTPSRVGLIVVGITVNTAESLSGAHDPPKDVAIIISP